MVSQRDWPREGFLDLLRFLAALSVVFFHYAFRGHAAGVLAVSFPELSFAKYGYLGVPLFFMISGYVIIWSIKGRTMREFVTHRFIRLYPTFWFCALLTLLVVRSAHMNALDPGLRADIANITMVPSWIDFQEIDGSYWSLATELDFYILVGAVVWAAGFEEVENALVVWLGMGAAIQAGGHVWLVPCQSYYPLFCFGGACYLMNLNGYRVKTSCLAIAALLLSVYNAVAMVPALSAEYRTSLNSTICALVILGAAALIFFSARISSLFSARLTRGMVGVGGLTYPLYLIHENSGYSIMNRFFAGDNRWVALGTTVAVMLASAAAIYAGFDRPVRKWLRKTLAPSVACQDAISSCRSSRWASFSSTSSNQVSQGSPSSAGTNREAPTAIAPSDLRTAFLQDLPPAGAKCKSPLDV